MRIGIDLGGTKIEGIILSPDGQVVAKQRLPTPGSDYDAIVGTVCELVESLQARASKQLTVGIGTPGALSQPTAVMKNCNSIQLNGRPLQQDLERRLGYTVRLENDANCFALSEAHFGAARNDRIVFGVILGTGTGGGIVIDKHLLNGPNSIAGEWGHNSLPSSARGFIGDDRTCYCGRSNCIETVLSGRGLAMTYQENYGANLSAADIAQAATIGDAQAVACLQQYCEQLARCLATVVNVIDPDVIVLGGGLSNIAALYTAVPELMRAHVFTDDLRTHLAAPSFGDASGALGAACLWPAPTEAEIVAR